MPQLTIKQKAEAVAKKEANLQDALDCYYRELVAYNQSQTTDNPQTQLPSIRGIAKRFLLSDASTLLRRIKGTQSRRQEAAVVLQRLTLEEEEIIVYYIHLLTRSNFPPRRSKVRGMAEALLSSERGS